MTTTSRPKKAKKSAFKEDKSPHVHQNKKVSFDLNIRELPWTDRQQEVIDAVLQKKSKLTIVDGIWGCGKSILAVYTCLKLLKEKKISNILYIRNIVQSGSGTLGWLGGDLETRLSPYMLPFQQKLDELLPKEQVDRLIKEKIVESQPVALLRGTSYNCYGIIIDEASCMTKEDIMLTLSRVGNFSYVFLIGDDAQKDLGNSGFRGIFDTFNDEESRDNHVHAFTLQDKMDVMRSELLRFIMKKVRGE
jgi:phosphate starvation-inducible PhoH-like protein